MFIFTLLFGVFGLHHLLLRSPQTMVLFLLGNFFTFGYWWFYDLIQLSPYGGNDQETLNKYGLDHPWGPLGLGQGMWKEDPGLLGLLGGLLPGTNSNSAAAANSATTNSGGIQAPPARHPSNTNTNSKPDSNTDSPLLAPPARRSQAGGGNSEEEDQGPPSPWWFFAYAILLFISPLAAYIAGDTWLSIDKFTYLITPLLGGWIFYLASLVYDYWMLFVQSGDLFVLGAKRFFPFPYLSQDPDGHSAKLTGKKEFKGCPPDNILQTSLKFTKATALPLLTYAAPGVGTIIEKGIDVATTAAQVATTTATTTMEVGGKVAHLASRVPVAAAKGVASAGPKALAAAKDAAAAKVSGAMPQMGGGKDSSYTGIDYITLGALGALIGGGMLLSIGRTLRSHYVGPTDAPPLA